MLDEKAAPRPLDEESRLYEEYRGLTTALFQNVPDPNFFFLSAQHRGALVRLHYTVRHNKGAALLIGDVGCGKTTLSRALILQLAERKYNVGLVTNPSLPGYDFLEEIDLQLGITPGGCSKVALRRGPNDRLWNNAQEGKDTVLMAQPEIKEMIGRTKQFGAAHREPLPSEAARRAVGHPVRHAPAPEGRDGAAAVLPGGIAARLAACPGRFTQHQSAARSVPAGRARHSRRDRGCGPRAAGGGEPDLSPFRMSVFGVGEPSEKPVGGYGHYPLL